MTNSRLVHLSDVVTSLWMVWSLTVFHLTSGRPASKQRSTCEGPIDCTQYKALMSVGNSSRPEKVLLLTNSQTHDILALKDVSEHPISLDNLFFNQKISNSMKEFHYRTFSGRYLTVNSEGHLTIVEPWAAPEAAKFVRYRCNQTETKVPAIYLLCAYVFNETTNEHTSYLVSPIRRAVKLSQNSCRDEAQFRSIAHNIISQGGIGLKKSKRSPLEDYQFLHVQVNEPFTAKSYLSKEVLFLCRNDSGINS